MYGREIYNFEMGRNFLKLLPVAELVTSFSYTGKVTIITLNIGTERPKQTL